MSQHDLQYVFAAMLMFGGAGALRFMRQESAKAYYLARLASAALEYSLYVVGALAALNAIKPPLQIFAAGFARSRNFAVHAPTVKEATAALHEAEKHRVDIAIEWLGEPLPSRDTPTHIVLSDGRRSGLFWSENIYITGRDAEERAKPLKHEVCHAVLRAAYPNHPCWVSEGIASRYDGPRISQYRTRAMRALVEDPKHAAFQRAKKVSRVRARDAEFYAASILLVQRELDRCGGDKIKFLRRHGK